MAPEVIESRSNWGANYSIVCDLWSLGAMLSEVLFGRPQWPRSRAIDRAYCDAVRDQTRRPCEADLQHLQRFLLQDLLVVNPGKRQTASVCYELAMALPPINEPSRVMIPHKEAPSLPMGSPAYLKTWTDGKEGDDSVQPSEPSTMRPLPGRGSKRRLEDDAEAGQAPPGSKRPFAGKMPCKGAPVPVGDAGADFEKPVSDDSDKTAPSDSPSLPAGASGAGRTIREPRFQLSGTESTHRDPAAASVRPGSPVPQSPACPTYEISSAIKNSAARERESQLSRVESAHRPGVGSAGPVPQSSEWAAHDVLSANRNSAAREPRP
ncbi:hypothetical protein MY1884_006226 [Beauveria asiatica]